MKTEDQIGFKVHKRRRVVERFFAWIGRNRRFLRDIERLIASAEAFLRRLQRHPATPNRVLLMRFEMGSQGTGEARILQGSK